MSRITTGDGGKHVVCVGAGGNIGSQIVPHLARSKNIAQVTLIDHQTYEARNLISQNIDPGDVGQPKAEVQARRLSRINPALRVEAVIDRIENVPLGLLRCDVICTGLDSRGARMTVNERAYLLGVPWIDAAVGGAERLARISVFQPGQRHACLECGWDEHQYALLEQRYACSGEADEPPPTNASSSLGAIAASVSMIECEKILSGETGLVAFGREIYMDVAHHNYYVSTLPPNVHCRFPGHRSQRIDVAELESVPPRCTIGGLFERADPRDRSQGGGPHGAFSVPGQMLVTHLTCPRCGSRRAFPHLRISLDSSPEDERTCCGGTMTAAGFDDAHELRIDSLSPETIASTLEHLGLRLHDIVCIRTTAGKARYFEVMSEEVAHE